VRTEKPTRIVACFAIDRHRILREHCGGVKKCPMMLATIKTVTKTDPVWESRCHNLDVTTKATAGELVHTASPLHLFVINACAKAGNTTNALENSSPSFFAIKCGYGIRDKLGNHELSLWMNVKMLSGIAQGVVMFLIV
jgi:hypothetical protein